MEKKMKKVLFRLIILWSATAALGGITIECGYP